MREEFLSYRFAGLKKPDEIFSHRNDVGWKCRKYIRWRQVHNEADDGKALKSFADELLDHNRIDLRLYGRISSILLNVQRWRLDKDRLSVDPPSNDAWEYVRTLLQVVNSSPQVITKWLGEKSVEIPKSPVDIQITFYLHLMDEFLSKQNNGVYVTFTDRGISFHEGHTLKRIIEKQFRSTYESVGLKVPTAPQPTALIKQIYDDFGFDGVSFQPELKIDSSSELIPGKRVFITYNTLETTKLLRVSSKHGNVFLELNDSHPFIQNVLTVDEAKDLFEAFFKCYAMSMIDTMTLSSAINTFNSYLETHLKQEFTSKK